MVETIKETYREAIRRVIIPDGQDAEPDEEQYAEEPEEAGGNEL